MFFDWNRFRDWGRRHWPHWPHWPRPRPVQILLFIRGKKVNHMTPLKTNDMLPFTISPADADGNPTAGAFDAPPVWSSSDVTVVAVSASADGLTGNCTSPTGKLAGATISVSGLVNGVSIQGTAQINVVPGDIASIVLVPGTPTPVVAAVTPAAKS